MREVVQLSSGGESLRLVFSNRYGKVPLLIGEGRVALSLRGSETIGGSGHAVTFGGQRSVTVPSGANGISDPLRMKAGPQLATRTILPGPVYGAAKPFSVQTTSPRRGRWP